MIRIKENITLHRKRMGLTQEALANRMGVTNQAVSKWESGQNCPDILLLPELAKLFGITVDELLGCAPGKSEEDILRTTLRKLKSLPQGKDAAFAYRIAAALHMEMLQKMSKGGPPAEWDVENILLMSAKPEWGYSALYSPQLSTTMRRGSTVFLDNRDADLFPKEMQHIANVVKPFADTNNLRVMGSLYALTVGDESYYATAEEISEHCLLPGPEVLQSLNGDLAPFIDFSHRHPDAFRIEGMYMDVFPTLALFAEK